MPTIKNPNIKSDVTGAITEGVAAAIDYATQAIESFDVADSAAVEPSSEQKESIKDVTAIRREQTVKLANEELGKPYVWGACGPDAYDCSGFVSYVLTGKHERLGTTYTFMEWPETSDPKPGDVCVSESHTGIYIGDGQMIHAGDESTGVIIGPVQDGMKYVVYPG